MTKIISNGAWALIMQSARTQAEQLEKQEHERDVAALTKAVNHIYEQLTLATNLKVGDYIHKWEMYVDEEDTSYVPRKEYALNWRLDNCKTIYRVVGKAGNGGLLYQAVDINNKTVGEVFDNSDCISCMVEYGEGFMHGIEMDENYVESQILDTTYVPYAAILEKKKETKERAILNKKNRVSFNSIEAIQDFYAKYGETGVTLTCARGTEYTFKPFSVPIKNFDKVTQNMFKSALGKHSGYANKGIVSVTVKNSRNTVEKSVSLRQLYRGIIPPLYTAPYIKAKKELE